MIITKLTRKEITLNSLNKSLINRIRLSEKDKDNKNLQEEIVVLQKAYWIIKAED